MSIKPEVLVHLDSVGELYKRDVGNDSITVGKTLIDLFKTHKPILFSALDFMIKRYLEKVKTLFLGLRRKLRGQFLGRI